MRVSEGLYRGCRVLEFKFGGFRFRFFEIGVRAWGLRMFLELRFRDFRISCSRGCGFNMFVVRAAAFR